MEKKFEEDEDDGRTIVNMNVDGMPWYKPWKNKDSGLHIPAPGDGIKSGYPGQDELSKEQIRMYRFAALKAALLVALVFGGVFAAFIAFCDFVLFN